MSSLLEMKNISKSFSGNKVLNNVNLCVEAGEVHALLGENGAGKSTLMKILGGIYTKDGGSIYIDGEEVQIHNVSDSRAKGVSIIHQELMLAQHLTIAENIFMGREIKNKAGMVNLKKQEQKAQEFLDQYEISLRADTRLDKLTIAKQQMVEIIRAVSFGARIIVMDEPTSSLSDAEVEILYEMIRVLKKQDVAVIYISHRLNELYDITDRITVLRDGEYVGTVVTKETKRPQLISMMVGRDLSSYYTKTDNVVDEVVLKVTDLSDGNKVKCVNFDLKKGEILGIAGLVGAGRSETVECLFGLTPKRAGTIEFKGKEVSFKNPREAMAEGFGLVPEDRKQEGQIVSEKIDDMHIKVTGASQIVSKLSGGNQQKVLIARWLCCTESVLILDEPTRGVDVKTKAEIYTLIDQLAKSGFSIIMVSSELPELINMSDRVMVLCNGYSTGILKRDELSQENIMTLATTEVSA